MNEKIMNLLGEELSKQVTEKLGDVKLGVVNDGTLVPAEKHENLKAELGATKEQLEKVQGDLKGFEGSESTIEELKSKLKESNDAYEQFKTETEKREVTRSKTVAVEKLLKENGALNSVVDLLVKTVDIDGLQVDSKGNVVDSDILIDGLKSERGELFQTKNLESDKPKDGDKQDLGELDDQAYFNKKMGIT